MILVNLFGAPGAGKSTAAAHIFAQLKLRGINAELVTEFAKDKVWEKNDAALVNQAYMFGAQYYRISRVGDQVDVILTDSPLLLSLIYNHDPVLGEAFNDMVKNVFRRFDSMNFFLNRVKKYNPVGRLQTESESDELAIKIRKMLDTSLIDYTTADGNEAGYDKIVSDIMQTLSDRGVLQKSMDKNERKSYPYSPDDIMAIGRSILGSINDFSKKTELNVQTRFSAVEYAQENLEKQGLFHGDKLTYKAEMFAGGDITIRLTDKIYYIISWSAARLKYVGSARDERDTKSTPLL